MTVWSCVVGERAHYSTQKAAWQSSATIFESNPEIPDFADGDYFSPFSTVINRSLKENKLRHW